ncbi:MAG TPA: hypothetical protein VKE88_00580 [Candidatus Nanoarchaeia archaeon]|nr:hypothetical protein [Candidatus Nanoarchaeia archaeon]
MKKSIAKGLSFGLTSAVITTMGLMLGLNSATSSKLAVVGGVVSLAFADGFSDGVAVHALVEAEGKKGKQVWEAAFSAFLAKFFLPLIFLVPLLFLDLSNAILFSIGIGLILLVGLSFMIAKIQKEKVSSVITEHLTLAITVLIITHYVGKVVAIYFGV